MTDEPDATDAPATADDLFEGTIGSLDALVRRKQAAADPERWRILYRVWVNGGEIPEDGLADHDEDVVQPLLDTNLLAHVPGRCYRLTTLGWGELRSDVPYLTADATDTDPGTGDADP